MYNSGKVIIGILVFLGVFVSPFLFNFAGGEAHTRPDPKLPVQYEKCVRDVEFMKAYHMDLLNDWRDIVVRKNRRFMLFGGDKIEMSLSRTCMKCHSSKVEFCDECHNYLDVNPYCWDCHVTPEEVKK